MFGLKQLLFQDKEKYLKHKTTLLFPPNKHACMFIVLFGGVGAYSTLGAPQFFNIIEEFVDGFFSMLPHLGF